jgi:hypothetical protein
LTGRGGEGMVLKPFDFIVRGRWAWFSRPLSAVGAST